MEDLLDENMFPHLLECQVPSETPISSTTYTCAEWPLIPSTRFPRSMRVIRFKGNDRWFTNYDMETVYHVFWQLLQALQDRFGLDYDHGMIEFHGRSEDMLEWDEVISKLSVGGLEEAARRRLIVFKDGVEIYRLGP